MDGLAVTVVTIGLSTVSLIFGAHLSSFFPLRVTVAKPRSSPYPLPYHYVAISTGLLFYLGAIFLLAFGPHVWRSRATFAIVLGPPGTLLRYHLGRRLNSLHPRLPLGTLAANILAVLIFAITAVLQRSHPSFLQGRGVRAALLVGLQDGFCGSLSTVSTFVVELRNLPRRDAYRYFIISWVLAQLVLVVVLGSYLWSR